MYIDLGGKLSRRVNCEILGWQILNFYCWVAFGAHQSSKNAFHTSRQAVSLDDCTVRCGQAATIPNLTWHLHLQQVHRPAQVLQGKLQGSRRDTWDLCTAGCAPDWPHPPRILTTDMPPGPDVRHTLAPSGFSYFTQYPAQTNRILLR